MVFKFCKFDAKFRTKLIVGNNDCPLEQIEKFLQHKILKNAIIYECRHIATQRRLLTKIGIFKIKMYQISPFLHNSTQSGADKFLWLFTIYGAMGLRKLIQICITRRGSSIFETRTPPRRRERTKSRQFDFKQLLLPMYLLIEL